MSKPDVSKALELLYAVQHDVREAAKHPLSADQLVHLLPRELERIAAQLEGRAREATPGAFDPSRAYDLMKVHTVNFTRQRIGFEQFVSDAVTDEVRDHMRAGMHMRMRGSIWTLLHRRVDVEHPRTWWDAFKLRWAPRWWLRRWPPRMVHVEVDAVEVLHGRALPREDSFAAVMHRAVQYRWGDEG